MQTWAWPWGGGGGDNGIDDRDVQGDANGTKIRATNEDDGNNSRYNSDGEPGWLNKVLEGPNKDDIFKSRTSSLPPKIFLLHPLWMILILQGYIKGEKNILWWLCWGPSIQWGLKNYAWSRNLEKREYDPKFNRNMDIENPKLYLMMKFTNAIIFRAILKEYPGCY